MPTPASHYCSKAMPVALFHASLMLAAPAANAAGDNAIVDAFGKACLPERLSFEKSSTRAEAIGWKQVLQSDNPELANVIAKGVAAANDPENPDWKMAYSLFSKQTGNRRLYLVVTRFYAPEVLTLIGCYVYDFNASKPIAPEAVSKLLDHTIAYSTLDKTGDAYIDPSQIVSYVWGPPPSLPRQFDTYLSFIPENSPLVEKTGFSGIVLKSSASEPRLEKTK